MGSPGRSVLSAVAISIAAIGGSAATGSLGATDGSHAGGDGIVSFKGKLRTDGLLSVGRSETVRVRGLPAKTRLRGGIRPPPSERNCFDIDTGICLPGPLRRVPGTRRFETDRKGRATLTFVMPDHYDLIAGPSDRVTLVNGQVIVVNFSGRRAARRGGRKVILDGYANAKAVVEVPPPPAP